MYNTLNYIRKLLIFFHPSIDRAERTMSMTQKKAKFEQVVKQAKAKAAGNPRWIAAIDKVAS
jgi:hypothetical protein